jgi:hypothetical protein
MDRNFFLNNPMHFDVSNLDTFSTWKFEQIMTNFITDSIGRNYHLYLFDSNAKYIDTFTFHMVLSDDKYASQEFLTCFRYDIINRCIKWQKDNLLDNNTFCFFISDINNLY